MASQSIPHIRYPKLRKRKRAAITLLLTLELLLSTLSNAVKRAGKRVQAIRRKLASRPKKARVYVMPTADAERVQAAIAADIRHCPDRLVSLLDEARKGNRQ